MMIAPRPVERRRGDAVQFQLVYLATLPVFLLGALMARLWPARRRARALSIVGQARAAAQTCGSFALMG